MDTGEVLGSSVLLLCEIEDVEAPVLLKVLEDTKVAVMEVVFRKGNDDGVTVSDGLVVRDAKVVAALVVDTNDVVSVV